MFYVLVFWPWGMWDLSSQTRDRTLTPCIRRQSLNHWATREIPKYNFLKTWRSLKIYLAALGLHCCTWAFSNCSKWRLLSSYSAQVSCGAFFYCRSQTRVQRFSCCNSRASQLSCGSWAQLPHNMWDLPRPGIILMSLSATLADRFSTIGPPRKPPINIFELCSVTIKFLGDN